MTDDEIPKGLSDAAKRCVNEILDVVVPYPDYSLAQQGALKVILYMLDVKLPMGVLVMANPGMGKTLFLSLIKRSLAIHASPLKLDRPVLELVLDSAVDVYQLAGKMMLALGYPALPMRQTLTTKHLAEGFDDAFGGQGGKVNPFRKAADKGKP